MQPTGAAKLWAQPYVKLRARLVALLGLEPCRQRGLEHVAYGRHVVVGHPLPQPVLRGGDHGFGVEHAQDVAHGYALGCLAVHSGHHAHMGDFGPERHQYAHAEAHLSLHGCRHRIGEQAVERHGQYDVGVCHMLQRYSKIP